MDPSTNCHSRPIKMTHILQIRHKSESDLILQESDLILQESESDPILGDFGKSQKSLNPLNEMNKPRNIIWFSAFWGVLKKMYKKK